ncbi:MAG: ribonuclease P protein component [Deltaproteobacteria bacterium]|nr:ribonuclease P protein component [Deltaproteobacteria bacterium]
MTARPPSKAGTRSQTKGRGKPLLASAPSERREERPLDSAQTKGGGYPKRIRLSSRKEITRVFEAGAYRRLGLLHAKYLPAAGPESRFMVSARRRVGSAPVRNRLKRLMREALRQNRLLLEQPYDICFFVRDAPEPLPTFNKVAVEISACFRYLNQKGRANRVGDPE